MTREARDIILLDDSFGSTVHDIVWGRSLYQYLSGTSPQVTPFYSDLFRKLVLVAITNYPYIFVFKQTLLLSRGDALVFVAIAIRCYNCTVLCGTILMVKPNLYITFRVTEEERNMLKAYCEQSGRAQSDVLREFVRSLQKKTSRLNKGYSQPSSPA